MRRRTFLTAAAGAAGLALAGRMRGTVPARAAQAADQKTLIMAPNFVIRSLDPGHTLEPDVKWSFDRVINLKSNPAFFLANVDEVLAPAPETVVIRLKQPQPSIIPILSNGALGIMDSTLVATQGGDASPDAKTKDQAEAWLQSHSAGSGPFMIQSYTPTQELVLARNPSHWRGPATLDRVVLRRVPEASTQALQLARSDLDIGLSLGQANLPLLRRV